MAWPTRDGAGRPRPLLVWRIAATVVLLLLLRGAQMTFVQGGRSCTPVVVGPNTNLTVQVWTVRGLCVMTTRACFVTRVWQRGHDGRLTFASFSGVTHPAPPPLPSLFVQERFLDALRTAVSPSNFGLQPAGVPVRIQNGDPVRIVRAITGAMTASSEYGCERQHNCLHSTEALM